MPNRTYVQMYVETGRCYYVLKDRLHFMFLLRDAYQYLCKHPEKIEDVVKERVRIGKWAKTNNMFQWLFVELQVINSWIVEEMFSGDTINIVPIGSEYRELKSINSETYDKSPNPIYIPKHIQHRKKGRK